MTGAARRSKPRRETTGQALVKVSDPLWDNEVLDILGRVKYYAGTVNGEPTPPEVRRIMMLDAERRLQKKVHELEVKIGYAS